MVIFFEYVISDKNRAELFVQDSCHQFSASVKKYDRPDVVKITVSIIWFRNWIYCCILPLGGDVS